MSETRPAFLPYGRQLLDEADIEAVVEVLRGDWLTTGPQVTRLEEAFARQTGASHAVACSSGTAGLHIAALALGLRPGETVIVPSVTFLATANAARYAGAEVCFADVDPDTGLLTAETLSRALERVDGAVTGIHPVHLAGQCVDLASVREIAARHDLYVLEDACHAIGASAEDADGTAYQVGGCRQSDAAVFSLHPVKTVTMGEGGLVTTNDAEVAQRLRLLRGHGMVSAADGAAAFPERAFDEDGAPNPWYYEMPSLGFNYRASDLHCALGLSQLSRLEAFVQRRRELVALYDALLPSLAPLVRPSGRVPTGDPAWHLYVSQIDFEAAGLSRARVMSELKAQGVGTQVHYIPVHLQPYYVQRYGELALPGADAWYRRALSLPLHAGMADDDVHRVVETLSRILYGRNRGWS